MLDVDRNPDGSLKVQPRPTRNNERPTWDLVVSDLRQMHETRVIPSVEERDRQGFLKYGVRLQPHNGRNSTLDAFEESMDLVVYLKNAIMEAVPGSYKAGTLNRLYQNAIGIMCALKDYMEPVIIPGDRYPGDPRYPQPDRYARENNYGDDLPIKGETYQGGTRPTGTQVPPALPFSPHYAESPGITEAPVALESQEWGNIQVATTEAVLGHPGASQAHCGVEVANLVPTYYVPQGLPDVLAEAMDQWKAQMDEALEAERAKFQGLRK
jgi:hypothetical protein